MFFSVDPGANATIGGMIATGASGTTTVRYGAMRENVVSLLVVTADGSVVRTRSRARKSSAGYDLTRLFIGSEGTLGLICEATLRVHPTPEAMAAAVCPFATLEGAVGCVVDVGRLGIPVARIELADAAQIDAINRYDDMDHEVAPTLFLEFHGSQTEVEAQAAEVQEIALENGASRFQWATDEADRRRLWHARHRAYDAARATRPGSQGLTTDVCVPVSRLAECIAETQADIETLGLPAPIVGHVGDGNFHVAVLVDPDDPAEVERAEAFHARLVRRAIAMDGTCTGEHGVGYGKAEFLVEEHGPEGVAMMRAIKRALDPGGPLQPGQDGGRGGAPRAAGVHLIPRSRQGETTTARPAALISQRSAADAGRRDDAEHGHGQRPEHAAGARIELPQRVARARSVEPLDVEPAAGDVGAVDLRPEARAPERPPRRRVGERDGAAARPS